MRISNEDLLQDATTGQTVPVSMGSTFQLRPMYLGHIANYSVQLVFTGTPNGTFTLQVSNDKGHPEIHGKAEQYADVTNWTTVTNSAQPISAAGDHTYQVQNAGYLWARVVWTQSSNTGSLTSARFNCKGV